ncbi:hypothetical protein C6P18_02395, partial [Weissella confusa]|uniref:hypothetical protein n=1 Tax=Weissella confusa TaxID=1583 RepID=UPI0011054FFB
QLDNKKTERSVKMRNKLKKLTHKNVNGHTKERHWYWFLKEGGVPFFVGLLLSIIVQLFF